MHRKASSPAETTATASGLKADPSLGDIRKTLPPEVFVPRPHVSIAYVAWDFAVVAALYAAVSYVQQHYPALLPVAYPLYAFAQVWLHIL